MTAVQLNAQIWRDMAEIAESEPLMKKLAKYLKKLIAQKNRPLGDDGKGILCQNR